MNPARIAALYRYPVKSMDGAELPRVEVRPGGIPGDRGWALRETATGRAASAKTYAALMLCRARFLDEPAADQALPPAEVELPDGVLTRTDAPNANALLSRLLGADVAFSRQDGGAGHFDARPLHFLTTAALATMRAKSGLDFDVRRFRPNVLVEWEAPGRPEDAWPGSTMRVGQVDVRVIRPVARCVMTTLPQPELPASKGIFPAVFADGMYRIPYKTADGRIIRDFLADPRQFPPKDEAGLRANMALAQSALAKAGLNVVTARVLNVDALLPTYSLLYLTKSDENPQHETRLRVLKPGDDIDVDVYRGAGVNVVQTPVPWMLVYIGPELGYVTVIGKTQDEINGKLAKRKEFLLSEGKRLIADKIVPLDDADYKFAAAIYFFQ